MYWAPIQHSKKPTNPKAKQKQQNSMIPHYQIKWEKKKGGETGEKKRERQKRNLRRVEWRDVREE